MQHEGHCYCGAVRYVVTLAPAFNAQCHCRECQYLSGGGPNYCLGIPEAGFRYTAGVPKSFRRADLDAPVTREFCSECGTHLLTRAPAAKGLVILKRGTLDAPGSFGNPKIALYVADKQSFHVIPEGVHRFERAPG